MNIFPLSLEQEDDYHFPQFLQHNDHFSQPQNCLNFFSGDVDQEANQNQKQNYCSQPFTPKKDDKQIVNFIEQVGRYLEPERKNYNKENREDKVNRYLMKKHKRVWSKKISYVCRQNVAKERNRQKGRFVGRKNLASDLKRQRANSTLSIEILCQNQV